MSETVYILCALTSLACAILLWRANRASPGKLLFYGALCFLGLAMNNVLLFVDLVVIPDGPDLLLFRNGMTLVSLLVFVYGLIVEVT